MADALRGSSAPPAEWTVAVYIGSDNSLDVTEEEIAGWGDGVDLRPEIQFVFELARRERTVRGRLVRGADGKAELQVLERAPRIDSASPPLVTAFLDWATETFPSRHVAFVLKDHGGGLDLPAGWQRTWPSPPGPQRVIVADNIVIDDVTHRYLSNPEVRALIQVSRRGHVDVLAFDACDMNVLEILYELRTVATFLVATSLPFPENPSRFPYAKALGALGRTPSMGPRDLAGLLATVEKEAYLVATELSWMETLGKRLDRLGAALLEQLHTDKAAAVRRARSELGHQRMVDLKVLLDRFARVFPNGEVGKRVKSAQEALQHARFAAGPQGADQGDPRGGIAAFFPQPAETPLWAAYGSLEMVRGSRWTGFLVKALWPETEDRALR